MNICSFVPGATEVVAALGLSDRLVGISHECDFPPSVRHAPVMIEPTVDTEHVRSAQIDREVKRLVGAGRRLYQLDEPAFLDAQPDLILTQDLCHACAITPDQLDRAIRLLPHEPSVVTLNPLTIEDMIHDVERIADAVGQPVKGRALADALLRRLHHVRSRTSAMASRPRVVCLEWLAPLYVAGHWVPQMVELAGGRDVLGRTHEPSRETTWEEVAAATPDVLIVMPCGYSIDRTILELSQAGQVQREWRQAHDRWRHMYIVDSSSYFSRPGPRLIDGVELLATILHRDEHRSIDPTRAIKLEPGLFGTGVAS